MSKLYDRSRVTTDWKCRRRRYFNYEHNGTGITSGTAAYELFFGTVIHDALATLATFYVRDGQVPIDAIANAGFNQVHDTLFEQLRDQDYALEQGYLAAGLIRGFYRYQWPKMLELYPDIVVIEQEVVRADGFMVKPDLILRSGEGTLVYIEYKTTSSKNDKWIESWQTNPQLHAYLRAIRDAHGLDIGAAVVVGLYKGYEQRGKQNSPFCYAYSRPGQPPFYAPDISYEWKAGYKKLPVWQIGDLTPAQWVDQMPDEVVAEQFVTIPPVYLNDRIADTFFRQAALRETEIQMALRLIKQAPAMEESVMDSFFPQNLEACRPGWGSGCPYAAICIDGVSVDDPRWAPRQPHHAPEIEQWQRKEAA